MRILVLSADYPNLMGGISLAYIHTRNKYYKEHGIDVNVLNFKTNNNYVIDEVPVYSLNSYKQDLKTEKFDLLIAHAPNIKNHYRFLIKYGINFPKFIFVFHGHEVLNINKVYSKPFDYVKQSSWIKMSIQEVYDITKLKIWNVYYKKVAFKSHYMFVSQWMYKEFLKWTKIDEEIIRNKYSITYNCVGKEFEELKYEYNGYKEYDFITVRGNLDGSKYCIDIVNKLAINNPTCKFLIIGKGNFFKYNVIPKNVEWIDTHLNHAQIVEYLNKSYCALMPTRTDAQGLMMCEMATYGIPVITSDIDVCKEVFADFKNIYFINNNKDIDLSEIIKRIKSGKNIEKNKKYFNSNTSRKEIETFYNVIGENT